MNQQTVSILICNQEKENNTWSASVSPHILMSLSDSISILLRTFIGILSYDMCFHHWTFINYLQPANNVYRQKLLAEYMFHSSPLLRKNQAPAQVTQIASNRPKICNTAPDALQCSLQKRKNPLNICSCLHQRNQRLYDHSFHSYPICRTKYSEREQEDQTLFYLTTYSQEISFSSKEKRNQKS